jgi:hypothetical protein
MEIKIFDYETCLKLLQYKTDEVIRELYDNDKFDYSEVNYLRQTMPVNLDEDDLDLGTKPQDDVNSSIKIFKALKDLNLVQANDKRLWVTLTHTVFFNYAKNRWGIDSSSSNDVIKDRFHFEGTALRQRNQNSLARLWWAAKITYDESLEDPFELTRILWEKQDFYQGLIDRNFSTYKSTLLAFINFYSKNRSIDLKYEMRKLFKGINAFGGVQILPLLDKNEVESEIEKLSKFYNIKTA